MPLPTSRRTTVPTVESTPSISRSLSSTTRSPWSDTARTPSLVNPTGLAATHGAPTGECRDSSTWPWARPTRTSASRRTVLLVLLPTASPTAAPLRVSSPSDHSHTSHKYLLHQSRGFGVLGKKK